MKYAIIIPDGCADYPVESLGGKTPLQAASIPNMDAIANAGLVGRSDNVPLHFPAGSEVANMSLFGCDPNQYFTGRAPIEAAAQGISLGPDDFAIRCNLVYIEDGIMVDFTADHISSEEAASLLRDLQLAVNIPEATFLPGVSYRNLLIYRGKTGAKPFSNHTRTKAPHDLTDLSVVDDYPRGPGSDWLYGIMEKSCEVFRNHPVNQKRIAAGKKPATNVWLWGLGGAAQLPSFDSRFHLKGAMITAVDLLRGLAALVGLDRIEVEGATGYLDTNYAGKGQAAIEALKTRDFVIVHVESTDEASHEGRVDEKLKALESIDREIVGPLHAAMKAQGDYRILVMPDHPTPVSTKKHSHGFVPFALCGSDVPKGNASTYDEVEADRSSVAFPQGWDLMENFIRGSWKG